MRHEEAVPPGAGAMAAVVGLTGSRLEELVTGCSAEGEPVDLANLNAPNQAVVSGHAGAVERLMEQAKERGAKLVVRLPISVPCHSRLLAGASARFARDLEGVRFNVFQIPVIPNCNPDTLYSPENARDLMSRQIVSPVRWQETIERMVQMGVDTIVEVGPKRVLSGLIKNIRKDIRLHYVGDAESLNRLGELARAA
jgi:[acyl-carrier-protein] S-malonyltransferase